MNDCQVLLERIEECLATWLENHGYSERSASEQSQPFGSGYIQRKNQDKCIELSIDGRDRFLTVYWRSSLSRAESESLFDRQLSATELAGSASAISTVASDVTSALDARFGHETGNGTG